MNHLSTLAGRVGLAILAGGFLVLAARGAQGGAR
jgi:hypothetical protein